MQMSAMKACFQIAECSLSSAKIRIFYQRAYTYFSEVITFIGVSYPLYLNTLTISLSPPTSWLHRFSIPVSEKPHFSITLPEAGFPVKWSAQMFSKSFSLMQKSSISFKASVQIPLFQ